MARGNLLEGNLYRTILRLSLPIMVNNFIQTLYNLVDSLWLGRVGSAGFAISFSDYLVEHFPFFSYKGNPVDNCNEG